jgi:hypothetical protein
MMKTAKSPAQSNDVPDVSEEERRRLAECCAFFKAEHYRQADPKSIRSDDVQEAEAGIEAIVADCCKRASPT